MKTLLYLKILEKLICFLELLSWRIPRKGLLHWMGNWTRWPFRFYHSIDTVFSYCTWVVNREWSRYQTTASWGKWWWEYWPELFQLCKWRKPTQNSLRGKYKKFSGKAKSHFKHKCSNNVVRNLSQSLGAVFSELASVSGRQSPCRSLVWPSSASDFIL